MSPWNWPFDTIRVTPAAFAARPEGEPPLVSLLESINSVSEELSRNRSRQFERFQLLKHTGGGASSGFLNERVTKRVAEMIRERDADRPDCELRAQISEVHRSYRREIVLFRPNQPEPRH